MIRAFLYFEGLSYICTYRGQRLPTYHHTVHVPDLTNQGYSVPEGIKFEMLHMQADSEANSGNLHNTDVAVTLVQ